MQFGNREPVGGGPGKYAGDLERQARETSELLKKLFHSEKQDVYPDIYAVQYDTAPEWRVSKEAAKQGWCDSAKDAKRGQDQKWDEWMCLDQNPEQKRKWMARLRLGLKRMTKLHPSRRKVEVGIQYPILKHGRIGTFPRDFGSVRVSSSFDVGPPWRFKPLRELLDQAPHGFKGQKLIENLIENNVPLLRATWLVRVVYLNIEKDKDKNKKRDIWTDALKLQIKSLAEKRVSMPHKEFAHAWKYTWRLVNWHYKEGIVNSEAFLQWLVSSQFSMAMQQQASVQSLATAIEIASITYDYLGDICQSNDHINHVVDKCQERLLKQKYTYAHLDQMLAEFHRNPFQSPVDPRGFVHAGTGSTPGPDFTPALGPFTSTPGMGIMMHSPPVGPGGEAIGGTSAAQPSPMDVDMGQGGNAYDEGQVTQLQAQLSAVVLSILQSMTMLAPDGLIQLVYDSSRISVKFSWLYKYLKHCLQRPSSLYPAQFVVSAREVVRRIDGLVIMLQVPRSRELSLLQNLDGYLVGKVGFQHISDSLFSTDNGGSGHIVLLCEWATSPGRFGDCKIHTTRCLLEALASARHRRNVNARKTNDETTGGILQSGLMDFLCSRENPMTEEFNLIARLFSELIRFELFDHNTYVRQVISGGLLSSESSHHHVFLRDFAVHSHFHHNINQRRSALYGPGTRGITIENEHTETLLRAQKCIAAFLGCAAGDGVVYVNTEQLQDLGLTESYEIKGPTPVIHLFPEAALDWVVKNVEPMPFHYVSRLCEWLLRAVNIALGAKTTDPMGYSPSQSHMAGQVPGVLPDIDLVPFTQYKAEHLIGIAYLLGALHSEHNLVEVLSAIAIHKDKLRMDAGIGNALVETCTAYFHVIVALRRLPEFVEKIHVLFKAAKSPFSSAAVFLDRLAMDGCFYRYVRVESVLQETLKMYRSDRNMMPKNQNTDMEKPRALLRNLTKKEGAIADDKKLSHWLTTLVAMPLQPKDVHREAMYHLITACVAAIANTHAEGPHMCAIESRVVANWLVGRLLCIDARKSVVSVLISSWNDRISRDLDTLSAEGITGWRHAVRYVWTVAVARGLIPIEKFVSDVVLPLLKGDGGANPWAVDVASVIFVREGNFVECSRLDVRIVESLRGSLLANTLADILCLFYEAAKKGKDQESFVSEAIKVTVDDSHLNYLCVTGLGKLYKSAVHTSKGDGKIGWSLMKDLLTGMGHKLIVPQSGKGGASHESVIGSILSSVSMWSMHCKWLQLQLYIDQVPDGPSRDAAGDAMRDHILSNLQTRTNSLEMSLWGQILLLCSGSMQSKIISRIKEALHEDMASMKSAEPLQPITLDILDRQTEVLQIAVPSLINGEDGETMDGVRLDFASSILRQFDDLAAIDPAWCPQTMQSNPTMAVRLQRSMFLRLRLLAPMLRFLIQRNSVGAKDDKEYLVKKLLALLQHPLVQSGSYVDGEHRIHINHKVDVHSTDDGNASNSCRLSQVNDNGVDISLFSTALDCLHFVLGRLRQLNFNLKKEFARSRFPPTLGNRVSQIFPALSSTFLDMQGDQEGLLNEHRPLPFVDASAPGSDQWLWLEDYDNSVVAQQLLAKSVQLERRDLTYIPQN